MDTSPTNTQLHCSNRFPTLIANLKNGRSCLKIKNVKLKHHTDWSAFSLHSGASVTTGGRCNIVICLNNWESEAARYGQCGQVTGRSLLCVAMWCSMFCLRLRPKHFFPQAGHLTKRAAPLTPPTACKTPKLCLSNHLFSFTFDQAFH